MNKQLFLVLFAVSLSVIAELAEAHGLKALVTVEGTSLMGSAHLTPRRPLRHATVTVTDADGNVLATTTTDDEGQFQVEAKQRVDHRIIVDGGDGHVATYTVRADELPDSLLPRPSTPLPQAGEGSERLSPLPPAPLPPAGEGSNKALPTLPVPDADWRTFIDQSIARQVRPLREQLDAYQEKIWWHDVLGGIGYILGLGGLAFGLSERRRRIDASPSTLVGRTHS
jgi:nickel transport protein